MNSVIREKRKTVIQGKKLTPELIYAVAKIVEAENVRAANQKPVCLYSLDATDGSSYESQSIEIFNPDGILSQKTVSKVSMQLNTEGFTKSIAVQFSHSQNANDDSYISIGGNDNVWVNGIMARCTEVVAAAEPQPKIVRMLGLGFFVAIIVAEVLFFRIIMNLKAIEGSGLPGVIVIFGGLIGIPILLGSAYNKVDALWPYMELQTGHQYNQLLTRNRRKAAALITLVIIPIVLTAVYDVVKNWMGLF